MQIHHSDDRRKKNGSLYGNIRHFCRPDPEIITEDSFREYLDLGPVLFIGDAAGKCSKVISNPAATFAECCPKASSMVTPAEKEYADRNFRDTAYFEPFYLKEFVATVSKKKI